MKFNSENYDFVYDYLDKKEYIAKDSFNYPDYPGFIRADVVFPELKESEHEKIRKELIK